jgi:hypothetical protein
MRVVIFSKHKLEIFWSRVVKLPSGCWEFRYLGGRRPGAYGAFGTGHGSVDAHVYSFVLYYGPVYRRTWRYI